jgi:hypothetical protein
MQGAGGGGTSGRPEFVAVIDADAPGSSGPVVEWSLPVEIPTRVLADLAGEADVHAVVVRNGVVLYAPGEVDLGRATRLANRAQRRALRAMYRTCALPGCSVHFDRCHLHHIVWWRHDGRTDLANLLPCAPSITAASITTDGPSNSDPTANSPCACPTAPSTPPDHPDDEPPPDRQRSGHRRSVISTSTPRERVPGRPP